MTPLTSPQAGQPPAARVAFVGAGPGDPGLMTVRCRDLLAEADIVVLDQVGRYAVVEAFARPGVQVIDAGHDHDQPDLAVLRTAKVIVNAARGLGEHGLVVRLMDGDPALFHGVADEALELARAGVPFEVVPGVSAVTAAAMYAGIPLTTAATTAVHVVDASCPGHDWSGLSDASSTVVVLGPPTRLGEALTALLQAGRQGSTPVALVEAGTTTAQQTRTTTLDKAPAALASDGMSFPVLAVLGPSVELRDRLSWFETKPLYGWQVLVPRTKEQSGATTERLTAYGARPTVVPTISVEPPRTPAQMERAVKGLVTGRYAWVGFTSVNAVRAVREKVEEFGLDARIFAGVGIAAVGGVTASALREWGLNPDLVPCGEQSAAGMLLDWPEVDDSEDACNRVFLPRADIATDTLVAGLTEMGWEVDDVTAYRTVRAAPPPAPIREAIKSGAFDAVLFTSSSTVRNLVGIAGKPHAQTLVACIGPQTAKTAEEHGLRVDVLAATPSALELVDALAAHGTARAAAAAEAGLPVRRPSPRRHAGRRRAR